jgi:hypothetical protein
MTLSSPNCKFYDRFKLDKFVYGLHVNLYCSLFYCDTSHCREGYRMQIIIEIVYSTEWVDTLVAILKEHDIEFIRID